MDQDSIMSSPSSHDGTLDEDSLFPEANTANIARPLTPQNDHLNAAAPGELSPPRSQTANSANDGSRARNSTAAPDDGEDVLPSITADTAVIAGDDEWRAGQGWKSKKAQEDMQRAWDNVVDKDFSLKEFGDVMAHRLSQ